MTEFTVVTPSDAVPRSTSYDGTASKSDGERTSSWVRRLWSGRAVRRRNTEPEDPLMAFAPETAHGRRDQGAIKAQDDDRLDGRSLRRRRIPWTHIGIAMLALVILAQGGLIAIWLTSREAAASPESGSVKVTSSPAGALVTVDGVTRGATPVSVPVSPGPHEVVIGQGAAARTQIVEVGRGVEASVYIELQPQPVAAAATALGGLQITTDPPGARVSVDGVARGAAPTVVDELAPGAHTVTVTSATGTITRQVTIAAGIMSSLIVAMNPGSEFASGWLSISAPIPAQVLQDGTLVGTTDTPRLMLPAGKQQIELVNGSLGYRAEHTVQITAGKTTTLTVDVPRGSLYVNALPWAEVWIDGRKAGETPIGNLQLPIGTHELLLKHPELGEQKRTVVIGASAPVRVGVDLRK